MGDWAVLPVPKDIKDVANEKILFRQEQTYSSMKGMIKKHMHFVLESRVLRKVLGKCKQRINLYLWCFSMVNSRFFVFMGMLKSTIRILYFNKTFLSGRRAPHRFSVHPFRQDRMKKNFLSHMFSNTLL